MEFEGAAVALWPVYESRFAGTTVGKTASKVKMDFKMGKVSDLSSLMISFQHPWPKDYVDNYKRPHQESVITVYFMQTPGCCGSVSLCNLNGHVTLSNDIPTVNLLLEFAEAIASLAKYTLAQYSTVPEQSNIIKALTQRGYKQGVTFNSRRTKATITFWSRIMDAPPTKKGEKVLCDCGDPDCYSDDEDDD